MLRKSVASPLRLHRISRSGRAQKLRLPKEGRTKLPNGNRTSNRTRRGKDRSREGAQPPNVLNMRYSSGNPTVGSAPLKRRLALPEETCVDPRLVHALQARIIFTRNEVKHV